MAQFYGLLLSLFVIVFLIKIKLPLYQAMGAGILVLVFFLGRPFPEIITLLGRGLIARDTLELVVAIGLICIMSKLMKDLDFLENLNDALAGFFRSTKAALVVSPALIGVFPVVGGAILSAPVVDSLGDRLRLSQEVKTSVNIVFRHAVYYFSPFTTSLILLAGIADIHLLRLIGFLFPVGIASIIAGYLILFRGIKEDKQLKSMGHSQLLLSRQILLNGSPLLLSLFFFIAGLSLPLSILAGIAAALVLGDRKKINYKSLLLRDSNPRLMAGIAAIMVFRYLMDYMEGIFVAMDVVLQAGIPLFLLFIGIPFLVGWVSASLSIAIGITAPILFPQVQGDPIFYAVLLYSSAFFSYIVAPIHLCQIVSNNYFNVKTFDAYRVQYPVLIYTFITGVIVFGLGVAFS